MHFEQIATGFAFLEAPRVDANDNLYFTDVMLGGVHRRSPDGTITRFLTDRKWVGGLALTDSGCLVCAGPGNLMLLDPRSGETRVLLSEVEGQPILSVNDIQPDSFGSVYGGVIDIESLAAGRPARDGYLFRLDPDGRATRLPGEVGISNGIGFSPDGRRLYHADTFTGIWVNELAADRKVTARRLFAKVSDCDGLAVDAEGGVWVAACQSGELIRYALDGSVDHRYPFPVMEVMSLTFGGADLRDLYAVTASPGVLDLKYRDKREGGIYRARSEFRGQVTPKASFQM